jgi:iron uptake system component EfeO
VRRRLFTAASVVVLSTVLVGCSGTGSATQTPPASASPPMASATSRAASSTLVNITLTNAACTPDRQSAPAGSITFNVVNDGADRVSELELTTEDDRILGEKENLTPGLSGDFTVQLDAGGYIIECPNADTPKTSFTVTAASAPSP